MEALDLAGLQSHLADTPLQAFAKALDKPLAQKLAEGHGDLTRWQAALKALPKITAQQVELIHSVQLSGKIIESEQIALKNALKGLMPWRKGPFSLFGVELDAEWRSDWKWSRLAPHVDFRGSRVLDVGCGNGYFLWRMLGAGADCVLGIDPGWLYQCQFLVLKHYLPDLLAWQLPLALEDLPEQPAAFDKVLSMGVLYHRRSPIDHLLALKECLASGGELLLETLVIEGDQQQVLLPQDRYAQMRNVWFLPSVAALKHWLKRLGFVNIRCLDCGFTTTEEQRRTEWMQFASLADFLNPKDLSRTIEGHPAPQRAMLLAEKP